MFFDPSITEALRNLLPWAGLLFQLITELGGELLYVGLIVVGYWAYRKKESVMAVFVLLTAILSNYWLKMFIANPRPDASYWYEGVSEVNYSTPSGHSQYSATLYGWLALKIKRGWMYAAALVLTLLIGISRVYLGVHYLGDVLLGWGIGLLTAVVLVRYERHLTDFFSRFREEYSFLALFLVGFAMMVVSVLIPPPPGTNFGNLGGLTMGIAVALPLERRYIRFSVEPFQGQKWRLVARVVIGLILVIGLMFGLEPLLPTEDLWLRAVRYFIASFVAIAGWPAIFKRANL
jgi:membrane-associated phospholipid phosphatase